MKKIGISKLFKFYLYVGILFILLYFLLVFIVNYNLQKIFINRNIDYSVNLVRSYILSNFKDRDFEDNSRSNFSVQDFNKFMNLVMSDKGPILFLKVWDKNGKLIFSSKEDIIDDIKTNVQDFNFIKAIRGNLVIVNDKKDIKKLYPDKGYKQALEIYVPIKFSGKKYHSGVVEIYQLLDPLLSVIRNIAAWFSILLLIILSIIYLLIYLVFRNYIRISVERDKVKIILESIGDGTMVVDRQGIITFFNPIAEQITGYSIKYAIGKHYKKVMKIILEKDRKPYYKFIEDAMNKGRITKMRNHALLINKKGKEIPIADSAAPIRGEKGDIVGCVIIFRDVTEEREIDRRKTEFISLASHQLRTPLSAIRWFLEMLLEGDAGKINDQQRDFLKSSYEATLRMNSLVNALLNVSYIEAGRLVIKPEPLDLIKFTRNIIEEMTTLLREKKQHLDFNTIRNLPIIVTDAKSLHEVITNLLSNAIKYTAEEGKIKVNISIYDKDYILFEIKDNGIGIPKEDQKHIFEKFFRTDNARKIDTEGTGLGLYIVKKLVEDNLEGKIWFKSRENKGTSFFFTLPIKEIKPKKGDRELT